MKFKNKKILASILFLLISVVCLGQGNSNPPTPRRGPPPPPGLPIDGASGILLIVGVLYGAHKGYRFLKDDSQ